MWLWGGLCALLGFLLGYLFFAVRYRNNRPEEIELLLELSSEEERITILQEHVDYLQTVISTYEENIAHYFEETAQYINHFSESYQELFEHLQHSAYSLVDAKKVAEQAARSASKESGSPKAEG